MEEREDQKDRLDFVRNQLNILTEDTKEKIKRVTEEVESKVSSAMTDEICRLSVLVDEFYSDFHPSPQVLKLYKTVSFFKWFEAMLFVFPLISTSVFS